MGSRLDSKINGDNPQHYSNSEVDKDSTQGC